MTTVWSPCAQPGCLGAFLLCPVMTKNVKEFRSFLGLVNFYRDMWPRRSHVLAPLTALTGKSTFQWTEACDEAFEEMKALAVMDTLLRYPDHNKGFKLETDSSDY